MGADPGVDEGRLAGPGPPVEDEQLGPVGGRQLLEEGRLALDDPVQRLAVHPDHQGTGLGRDLVVDCLRWVRRRGGTKALVNTQEANERALALYTAMGFKPEKHGLAVLECDLTGAT